MKKITENTAQPIAQGLSKRQKIWRSNWRYLVMVFPVVIKTIIFSILPLVGLVMAFENYNYIDGLFGSEWIGFKNFEFFFTSPAAKTVTVNTVLMNLLFIGVGTVFTTIMALLINEIKGRRMTKIFQTIFFYPYLISWVIVAFATDALLMNNGIINQFLRSMGGEGISFYTEPKYWPFILLLANIWKGSGYGIIMYFAVLTGIDKEYYEAAELDGATRVQKMWYISLPHLKQLIIILTIMSVGGIFRSDFGMFYFLPRDYAGAMLSQTTDVIDTYIYRATFMQASFGMSTAIGLYQSIVGCLTLLACNFIVRLIDRDSAFI